MTDIQELIKRLEKAEEGSGELDFYIQRAVDKWLPDDAEYSDCTHDRDYGHCWKTDGHCVLISDYTTSLDAALTLVPKGCRWAIQQDHTAAFAGIDGHRPVVTGTGTPALALCIAALRARENG